MADIESPGSQRVGTQVCIVMACLLIAASIVRAAMIHVLLSLYFSELRHALEAIGAHFVQRRDRVPLGGGMEVVDG